MNVNEILLPHSVTTDITATGFELRLGISHLLREGLIYIFFARWIFVVLNAEGCDIICKVEISKG